MADNPADVMRKHLKEELIPPDHINTSLSAGISEVVEVMMAKRREDRYKNIKELLIDLKAVREGQPPLRAHKRFDMSAYKDLEEGDEVEFEDEVYESERLMKYRMAVYIMGAVSVISLVGIVLLIMKILSRN